MVKIRQETMCTKKRRYNGVITVLMIYIDKVSMVIINRTYELMVMIQISMFYEYLVNINFRNVFYHFV